MTITFTSDPGAAYSPRLESDLGNSFTVAGETDTITFEESLSEVNMVPQITLAGGLVSITESSAVPVLTLTTLSAFDAYVSSLGAAYSVSRRVLSPYTGPLIRVRRVADGELADFGFTVSGELDTAALLAWVLAGGGVQGGAVHTIYDQSGNSRDLIQATSIKQLMVVSGGLLNTVGDNEKAACRSMGAALGPYATDAFAGYTGSKVSSCLVGTLADTGSDSERFLAVVKDATLDYAVSTNAILSLRYTGLSMCTFRQGLGQVDVVALPAYGDFLRATRFSETETQSILNEVATVATPSALGAFDFNRVLVGGISASNGNFNTGCRWAEAAVWLSDIGATKLAAIQAEQASFFGI